MTALLRLGVATGLTNLLARDVQSMGYTPITPTFKPGIKVIITSQRAEIMFGGFYNLAERQCFWCDNVGITPIISKTSPETEFRFNIVMESTVLERCKYLPFVMRP